LSESKDCKIKNFKNNIIELVTSGKVKKPTKSFMEKMTKVPIVR